jgi:hypothetical protein
VHDGAAKVFSKAFYAAVAARAEGSVPIATAFDAGRAAFLREGYKEGDPDLVLHKKDHPHCTGPRYWNWRNCPGCNPPVHGQPVLVTKARPAGVRQSRSNEWQSIEDLKKLGIRLD